MPRPLWNRTRKGTRNEDDLRLGQFLIIKAEDFFAETQAGYDDVLEFLDLPGHRLEERKRHNVGKYTEPMADETRQDLADYFRPHNQRLYDFLGRDFGWS